MNAAAEDAASEPAASVEFQQRSLSARTERTDHLESLLLSLETTIFIIIGVAYVCDNLTFLLLLHVSCQLLYTHSSQLSPTIVANLISIVTHIFHARPEGTKATRGYLHGGLLCDFVGELGPISRSRLLILDALIVGLQLGYLAVNHELEAIKGTQSEKTTAPPQDLEAEEAGVRRDEQDSLPVNDDEIEMQPMLQSSTGQVDKSHTGAGVDEDLIITLDLRRSLVGVFRKNASTRSDNNAGRLGTIFDRIAEARATAIRA